MNDSGNWMSVSYLAGGQPRAVQRWKAKKRVWYGYDDSLSCERPAVGRGGPFAHLYGRNSLNCKLEGICRKPHRRPKLVDEGSRCFGGEEVMETRKGRQNEVKCWDTYLGLSLVGSSRTVVGRQMAEKKRKRKRSRSRSEQGEASDQGAVEEGQDLFWWGDKALQGTLMGIVSGC